MKKLLATLMAFSMIVGLTAISFAKDKAPAKGKPAAMTTMHKMHKKAAAKHMAKKAAKKHMLKKAAARTAAPMSAKKK